MSKFIDKLSDLKDGDEVVVTSTGRVRRTKGMGSNVILDGAYRSQWVYQEDIDTGQVSIERINLKETRLLEPGIYTPVGAADYYYVVLQNNEVRVLNLATNRYRPTVVTAENLFEALAAGEIRKLS